MTIALDVSHTDQITLDEALQMIAGKFAQPHNPGDLALKNSDTLASLGVALVAHLALDMKLHGNTWSPEKFQLWMQSIELRAQEAVETITTLPAPEHRH